MKKEKELSSTIVLHCNITVAADVLNAFMTSPCDAAPSVRRWENVVPRGTPLLPSTTVCVLVDRLPTLVVYSYLLSRCNAPMSVQVPPTKYLGAATWRRGRWFPTSDPNETSACYAR